MKAHYFKTTKHQKGVVLVTALIVLVLLTIIGVTAMNTSTLEERMAYNMQQDLIAFHGAESGFNLTFKEVNTIKFDPDPVVLDPITIGETTVNITTAYREITAKPPLKKNAKPYSSKYQSAHFDIISAATAKKSHSTVRAGMYQILPGGS